MPRISCRGLIALVVVVVALAERPVAAQVVVIPSPGPGGQNDGLASRLTTGVQYDIVNRTKAEQCLRFYEAKRQRDVASCNQPAAERDGRKILNLKQRIAVDTWLIRQNSLCDPGYYPLRIDTDSVAALNQATRPQ